MTDLPRDQEELVPRELFGGALALGIPARFVDVSNFRPVPDNQEVQISSCERFIIRYQRSKCSHLLCSGLASQVFTYASVDQSFVVEVLVRSVYAAASYFASARPSEGAPRRSASQQQTRSAWRCTCVTLQSKEAQYPTSSRASKG